MSVPSTGLLKNCINCVFLGLHIKCVLSSEVVLCVKISDLHLLSEKTEVCFQNEKKIITARILFKDQTYFVPYVTLFRKQVKTDLEIKSGNVHIAFFFTKIICTLYYSTNAGITASIYSFI